MGERGLKLSGGEKQRVSIARTLLKNPPHHDLRRGHLRARLEDREGDPGGARGDLAGPHDARHRAPAVHGRRCRPDPGDGRRADRRARDVPGADRAGRAGSRKCGSCSSRRRPRAPRLPRKGKTHEEVRNRGGHRRSSRPAPRRRSPVARGPRRRPGRGGRGGAVERLRWDLPPEPDLFRVRFAEALAGRDPPRGRAVGVGGGRGLLLRGDPRSRGAGASASCRAAASAPAPRSSPRRWTGPTAGPPSAGCSAAACRSCGRRRGRGAALRPARWARSAASTSRGASLIIEWPASTTTKRAPGISFARACPAFIGVIWSRLPARTSVGTARARIAAGDGRRRGRPRGRRAARPGGSARRGCGRRARATNPERGSPRAGRAARGPRRFACRRPPASRPSPPARKASPTGMGTEAPRRASFATRSGWRSAVSSATSEPMLWPTTCARSTHAASMKAATQSAHRLDGRAQRCPGLRPWPGRSTASTEKPWCAR